MLELNVGDRFIATDRLGRNSTWKLIKKKDDIHFLLEACGETLKKCERDYLKSLKRKGSMIVNPNRKRTTKKDFSTIEVGPAWFQYRIIEKITEDQANET